MILTGEGSVIGSSFDSHRTMDKYINWLKAEFAPLTLATPDSTLEQIIENAIRYWNTHSAYKCSAMYDFTSSAIRVQLSTEFKQVVQVIPGRSTNWIWEGHPLWTLTGVTILDNVTTDLIMMSEAYRNYKTYVGNDMDWTFQPSTDPTIGGYLYVKGFPSNSDKLHVVGTKRIIENEEIKQEHILNWILEYSKGLLKTIEGNTLRKSSIIGIANDGQELVNEGKEECEQLRKSLSENARWVVMATRV